MGKNIQGQITKDVKQAMYFSILVDETTDSSCQEQLSLSVCYVHDGVVKE